MSVQSDIFIGMAEIYEAGAKRSRSWSMNNDRQQDADVYEAMAAKARGLAVQHGAPALKVRVRPRVVNENAEDVTIVYTVTADGTGEFVDRKTFVAANESAVDELLDAWLAEHNEWEEVFGRDRS